MSPFFRAIHLSAILLSLGLFSACEPEVKTAEDFHREGIVQTQKNNLDSALENLDKAVMLESSNPTILVNRGLVQDELGQHEKAIADYTRAIELDETLAEAYYNRANAHHNLEQFEQAIADYTQAIEQVPDFAYAYVNRAINLEAIDENERAIADLKRAVDMFQANGDTVDVKRVTAKIDRLELTLPKTAN